MITTQINMGKNGKFVERFCF